MARRDRRAFYDSQRNRENYTFHPKRTFGVAFDTDPGDCFLLALDHRELALLRAMVAVFPKYHWVWGLPSPQKEWSSETISLWGDISEFIESLEVTLMSGCQLSEFVTQLDRIATALEGDRMNTINVYCGGCGGSGCANCNPTGSESGSGSAADNPPYNLPNNTIPPGFASLPEYATYKCKAANVLLLGIAESMGSLGDMGNYDYSQYQTYTSVQSWILSKLQTFQQVALFLAFGLPEYSVAANVRAWVADKIASVVFPTPDVVRFEMFYGLRLNFLDNREQLVCDLYGAESTSDARAAMMAQVDDYLSGVGYSTTEETWVRDLIEGNLSNAYLSQLFTNVSSFAQYEDSTAVDCDGCAVCDQYHLWYGEVTGVNGDELTIQSEYIPGAGPAGHAVSLGFGVNAQGGVCGGLADIKIISIDQTSTTDCAFRLSTSAVLAMHGCGNPGWTVTNENWATHIGVQYDGTRTLTLFKAGATQFTAVIEVV